MPCSGREPCAPHAGRLCHFPRARLTVRWQAAEEWGVQRGEAPAPVLSFAEGPVRRGSLRVSLRYKFFPPFLAGRGSGP